MAASAYEISDELKYADPTAANQGTNNDTETGLLWRDGLNGIVKVLSASAFVGRVLGITDTGEITWVDMSNPVTAFGEVSVAQVQPVVQLSFLNGLSHPELVYTYSRNGGSITYPDNDMATISLAAQANSVAALYSKEELVYRPGQGSIVRITGRFNTPTTNSRQYVGIGNYNGGFFFGYQNTTFGIFRLYGGYRRVQSFTVTAAATGNETATVTLNGVAVNVSLTSAANATNPTAFTAYQIGQGNFSTADFRVEVVGSMVYFFANYPEVRNGTYSFSSTGAATASTALLQSGADYTEDFVAQTNWNGDDIQDGSGASGHTIDPTKGNVYQIQFQWLGFGAIFFSIENPVTEEIEQVHTIKYPNSANNPSLSNPSMFVTAWTRALGGTPGSALALKTPCFFGGTEGAALLDFPATKYSTLRQVSAITANTNYPVLTIRHDILFNGRVTTNVVRILFVTVASDSSKPIQVRLVKNATIGDGTVTGNPSNIQNYPLYTPIKASESVVSRSAQAITITGGSEVLSFVVGKTESSIIDISKLAIILRTGEWMTIACNTTNSSNDITATISFVEDHS